MHTCVHAYMQAIVAEERVGDVSGRRHDDLVKLEHLNLIVGGVRRLYVCTNMWEVCDLGDLRGTEHFTLNGLLH